MSTAVYVALGALFIVVAVAGSVLKRLPVTTSMVYLAFGFAIGPSGLGLFRLDPLADAALLERLTEIAVIISLFTAGLKLHLARPRWRIPILLATVAMVITIGMIAAGAHLLLGLPLGAAILLGAILAPTDPVLASDVQVEDPGDRDRLRVSLTGEAGLNDGAAFPFVMLGLGLLGLHELGSGGMRWVLVDVLWAAAGGLVIGAVLGWLVANLVLYLRREYREALGLDDFLALGLIALSYGVALLAHTYGFLAVFAAGLALRRVESEHSEGRPPADVLFASSAGAEEEIAADPERGPAYMVQAVLGFNEQLERIAAAAIVTLVGALISPGMLTPFALGFAALLLLVIRPAAVAVGLLGSSTLPLQRQLMGWFGMRGIGSLYYLMFAIHHGLPSPLAEQLTQLTLTTVGASVLVHGISVTPLMDRYTRYVQRRRTAATRA